MTGGIQKALERLQRLTTIEETDMQAGTMKMRDGRVWHYKRDCYGHPPGACKRRISSEGESYCAACQALVDSEREEQVSADRSAKVISEAIDYGILPGWFASFKAHSLHPWQRAALDQLHARPDCNAWIGASRGTGKTSVAYHYLHQCTRAGVLPMFITASALGDSQCDARLRRFASARELLVIDDAHNMHLSQYSVSALHNVLSARQDKQVRTIITAEISGAKFGEMISAAVGAGKGKSTLDRLSWPKRQCMAITFEGARNLRHDK